MPQQLSGLYNQLEGTYRRMEECLSESSQINGLYISEIFKSDISNLRERNINQVEDNLEHCDELVKIGRKIASLERRRRELQGMIDRELASQVQKEERKKTTKRLQHERLKTRNPLR